MKRLTKRMLWALLGIILGWYAAGFVPAGTISFAGEQPHAPTHLEQTGVNSDYGNAGVATNAGLRPLRTELPWKFLWKVMAGLFVAAMVLGVPAKILKGPDSPDPVAQEDH